MTADALREQKEEQAEVSALLQQEEAEESKEQKESEEESEEEEELEEEEESNNGSGKEEEEEDKTDTLNLTLKERKKDIDFLIKEKYLVDQSISPFLEEATAPLWLCTSCAHCSFTHLPLAN
jgi:hypothetical protein